MPRFTFTGFNPTASVAVSITQGGISRQASVAGWGQAMAQVGISARTTSDTVPCGVILEAGSYADFLVNGPGSGEVFDPTFHDIYHVWTAEKSDGAGGWDSLGGFSNPALNLPDAWRDRSVMHGAQVAFVFDEPGDYRVKLWCIELTSGRVAEAEWTKTVADASSLPTAYVSDAGDFSAAPGGTAAADKISIAGIPAWIAAHAGPSRVLFRRGETFAGFARIDIEDARGVLHVGAFGTGADPVLRPDDDYVFDCWQVEGQGLTFEGLRMLGTWDATRECGRPVHFIRQYKTNADTRVLVHKCEMGGSLNDLVSDRDAAGTVGAAAHLNSTIFSDSHVHDWGTTSNYGCLSYCARTYVVGCAFHQPADVCLGSMQKPFLNYGAAFRKSGAGDTIRCTLAASSFFAGSGWSGGQLGLAAQQGGVRFATNADAGTGARYNFDRIAVEGGSNMISSTESGTNTQQPLNALFDRLLMVPTPGSQSYIVHPGTMRNVITLLEDFPTLGLNGEWQAFMFNNKGNYSLATQNTRAQVYSSTVYSRHSLFGAVPSDEGWLTDLTRENNVIHAAANGQTGVAITPVDLEGYTPIMVNGQRFSVGKPVVTLGAAVAPGQGFDVPYPTRKHAVPSGSAQATGATQQMANTDFDPAALRDAVSLGTGGGTIHYASDGAITVDVSDPAKAVVTNTSGTTWAAGTQMVVNLVPKDASNPTVAEFALPPVLKLPMLAAGSAAIDAATAGLTAWDDALLVERAAPKDAGALEYQP